jgi:hypothetical protein
MSLNKSSTFSCAHSLFRTRGWLTRSASSSARRAAEADLDEWKERLDCKQAGKSYVSPNTAAKKKDSKSSSSSKKKGKGKALSSKRRGKKGR